MEFENIGWHGGDVVPVVDVVGGFTQSPAVILVGGVVLKLMLKHTHGQ